MLRSKCANRFASLVYGPSLKSARGVVPRPQRRTNFGLNRLRSGHGSPVAASLLPLVSEIGAVSHLLGRLLPTAKNRLGSRRKARHVDGIYRLDPAVIQRLIAQTSAVESATHAFTDGSYDARASVGGWAYVVLRDGQDVRVDGGASPGRSNNFFELLGVLNAASWLAANGAKTSSVIFTDSRYVVQGCGKWRHIWRNNGWRRIVANSKARKRSIPDNATWQALDALLVANPNISVEWCKGHSGIPHNEHADLMALAASRRFAEASRS
ncbi:ribonuclease HI [Rhizobium deserti]|uniref:ribonuclease H n=1 Tax=Rhizobium deserti TaxID=2547961 RepID=A0A4R5U9K9_9HYPH|nr:ribonuclease H [Rhizobium deserti]TDK31293.1 ribonuclease HI [Rhizobium deserti]